MRVTDEPQVRDPADDEDVLGNGIHTSPPDTDRHTRLTPGRRARAIVTELGPQRHEPGRAEDDEPAELPEEPLARGLERGKRVGRLIHEHSGAPASGISEGDDLDTLLGPSRSFADRQAERRERAALYAKELHLGWLGPAMNFTDLLPALLNTIFRSGQWWTDRQGRFWASALIAGMLLIAVVIAAGHRH
jgi:hypothetical protein